jgi:hypothetical protein
MLSIIKTKCKILDNNDLLIRKKAGVHKYISAGKAPTDDRRDELRFQLRAKISQKDYVDRKMKAFHYN